MYGMWKRLFIVVTILLVSCSAFGGYFWYQLDVTKNQLADTKIQLDNTLVELDNTQTQLDVTKAQLDMTATQLETEKNKNSQMLSQYIGLKQQIDVRLGSTSEDRQSFITPSDPLVSAKVLKVTGGYSEDVNEYWRDCERLYRWVVSNITYSSDSYMPILPETISGGLIWGQECWRMPKETLEDEIGDCEDMAVLLTSMLRSYNEGKYQVWVLVTRSSVSGVGGHAAVGFPVQGGRLAILDPAGNYYTGQYGSLQSESISIAVSNWLSRWQREMAGAEIVEVFSESVHEEFSSTAEFVAWAQE